jgi:predicted dienelactone hydrolase
VGTPADFAQRGPHPVGVRTALVPDPADPGRTLPTDLWYPAAPTATGSPADHPFGRPHDATVEAEPLDAPAPLAVFSHGNSGLRRQSTFLTTHLASWGIAVVAPDHTGNTFPEMMRIRSDDERIAVHRSARAQRPNDALAALDAALSGRFGEVPLDGSRVAALGHSFGGWTATKLPGLDERISAICALAPASEPFVGRRAYAPGELPFPRPIPTLIVAGIDDVLVDLETSIAPLVARLGAPRTLVGVEAADHFHFCDGIELLHGQHLATPRPGQPRPTKPYERCLPEERCQQALRGLVSWFVATSLTGDLEALERLDADLLQDLDPALVPL